MTPDRYLDIRAAIITAGYGDKVWYCATLPWIGEITKWHLAKNLGVDCAKPDIHLTRLAKHYGTTPAALCAALAAASGDRIATVDLVIWRACNLRIIKTRELAEAMQMSEPIKCFVVDVDGKGNFRRKGTDWRPLGELPPGGMYFADWYQRKGSDGHHLIVKTPGGLWHVDRFANNCTRPGDWGHYCWVRHGNPPNITVDKNGETCGCGCSIGQGEGYRDYHGFLRNGELVSA